MTTATLNVRSFSPYTDNDVANAALSDYLGGEPLTEDVLSQIVVAGCRSLARQDADATVLALRDTRDALSSERDTLRREMLAAREMTATDLNTAASAISAHTSQAVGTMSAQVTSVLAGLPSSAREQVAPMLEVLLGQFSSQLTQATRQMLDVNSAHSVTHGLTARVEGIMSAHTEKVSARIGALETTMSVADARAAERAKSSAKGQDFEDALEEIFGGFAEDNGLAVMATGDTVGKIPRNKKGDFVISDGDVPLVVIEAKNKSTPTTTAAIHAYLDEAQRNRDTPVAVWVVSGISQGRGKWVQMLSETRWIVVSEPGVPNDMLLAVLRFAVITARRRVTPVSSADTDTAKVKVSEALTAAHSLSAIQDAASQVMKSATDLTEKVNASRARITALLLAAAEALEGGGEPA